MFYTCMSWLWAQYFLHNRKKKVTLTGWIIRILLSNSQCLCRSFCKVCNITKTRLFKYIESFTAKKVKFSDKKKSDIYNISPQNIDCGYSSEPPQWGSSNEYPQSMFFSRNQKNNVYPYKPQFYYIKVGFKGVKII